MSQEVYFRPVEGIGTAATAKTAEEKRKLEEQLKRKEQVDKDNFIRHQYESAEDTRRLQEMRGDRSTLVENLAGALTGFGIISPMYQQAEINRIFEQSAKYNAVKTPFVNHWASVTSNLPNNPFRDKALLASMLGPNGEQLFSDASQAQEHFRIQAMFAALYKHYKVDEKVKVATESHVSTAREAVHTILNDKQLEVQSGQKVNEPINPTAEQQAQQQINRAVQLQELRVTLQREIERTAVAAGMKPDDAKTLAAEVTAAFLHEQATRDQALLDMKTEQVRVQSLMKEAATKEQAAKDAAAERAASEVKHDQNAVNLDAKTCEKIEQQRAKAAELKQGGPGDPTKPGELEFNNDPNKKDPTAHENTFEPRDVPTANFQPAVYDEFGNASDVHTDIAVGGAATNEAAKRTDSRSPKSGPRSESDLSVRETREGIHATGPAAVQPAGRQPRGLVGPGDPEWNPNTNNKLNKAQATTCQQNS